MRPKSTSSRTQFSLRVVTSLRGQRCSRKPAIMQAKHCSRTTDVLRKEEGGHGSTRKLCAPAAERNCEHILSRLVPLIEDRVSASGRRTDILEVASGTGQHAAALAVALGKSERLARIETDWTVVLHPSDIPSDDGFGSIRAYAQDVDDAHVEMREPISLDCTCDSFVEMFRAEAGRDHVDGIFAVNMCHISPLAATEGLVLSAGRLLCDGGFLAIYGPFKDENDQFTTESNKAFDAVCMGPCRRRSHAPTFSLYALRARSLVSDFAP